MAIEARLTAPLGEVGRKLHTARSRNDQVAADLQLYLRDRVRTIVARVAELQTATSMIPASAPVSADDGLAVHPYAITAVVDENGKVIEGHEFQAEQVLSPDLAYMMQFMLEQVINHGTGAGARPRRAGGR